MDHLDALALHVGRAYRGSANKDPVYGDPPGPPPRSKMQLPYGTHWTDDLEYAKGYTGKQGAVHHAALTMRQPLDLTKGFWWRGEPGFEQALALSQALGKKAAYGITYTNPETLKRMSEPQGVGINTSMLDKAGAKRAYSALLSAGYDGIVYEPRHGGPVTPGAHQMNPDVQWGSMTLTNRKAPRSYVSLTRDGFELIPPIDSPDSPTNDIAEDQPSLMRRLEETAPLDELAREQASQGPAEHPILARLSPAERAMLGQPLSKKSSRRYPTAEEYPIVRDWLVGNSQKMQPYLTPDMTAYTPGETLWLMDQPAYKAWHEYAANFKVPEGYSTVVFVPCAKTKPWDKATSDRASKTLYKSYNAIREQVAAGELPPVYFATISEPLGIVPENNWGDFITRSPYDNPGLFPDPVMRAGGAFTSDWLEKFGKVMPPPFDKEAYGVAIDRLSDVIAAFMKNNSHLQYLAFVDDPNPRKPTTHGDMVRAANQKVGGLIDEANIFSKKPLPPKNVSARAITPQNFMTDKIKQLVSWAKDAPDAVVSPEMDDPMPGSDVAEEMAMRQDSANAAGDSTDTLFQGGPRRPKAASAAADANVDLTGKSFTPEHIAEAFGIPDHQARAVHFLAKSMGLNMRRLRVAVGDDADMAVYEGEKSQTGFDQEYLNRRLRETSLVSLNDAAQLLGPKAPEYLNAVVEFMKSQRQKAIAGEFLPSDVAKAYLLTLGSMHSSENNLAQIEKKTGLKFPPEYVTYNKNGVPMIRPEEAVAYWFTTEEGKAALDAVNRGDYRTDYDADLFKGLNKLRDIFGTNDIRNNALGIKRGVYTEAKNPGVTMKGIRALTDRINAAQGDVGVISAALTELTGIGSAKVGFIKHLLGFGDTATADAVEINYWLTGQGDVSQLNTRQAELARDLKAKGSGNPVTQAHLQRLVQARLEGLYDLLGLGEGPNPISRDFAIHFLHHWLWDKAKQTETTHRGSMGAVADHINPTFAQSVMNRNARVIKGLTRFVNAKKAIMKGFAQADLGTAIHELSHAARRLLFDRSIPAEMRLGITDEDIKAVEDWCGVAEDGIWHRDAEEAFANANEQYFKSGFEIDKEGNVANPRSLSASVQKVIANIVNWLKDMYVRITRTGKEEKYNPSPKGVSAPVRQAFDNLYTRNDRLRKQGYTEKQIQNMRFVDSRSQDPDGTPPRLYEEGDMPNDASKKSTPEESSGDSNFRCTEATLRAFGIEGHTPKSGMGVIQALQDAGQKPVPVDLEGMKGARTTTTRSGPSTSVGLADFIREHPTGRYYLASAGHAMALIDGVLTDTSGRKVSNNLRIWGAMKLSDPVSEPSVAQAPKKTYRIGAYGTGPEGKNRAVILDWVGAKNPEITEFPVRELDARNPVTLVFEAENDSEARRFLEENLLPDDKRPLYLTKDMAKTFRLDPKAATTPQEYEPFQIKSNGRLPSKASRLWVGLLDQLSDTDEELQKAIADHNAASPEERPALEKQVQRLSRTAEGIMDMMETFRSDVENQTDGLMDDMSDAAADRYETWRDQWTDPLEWEGLTKDQDGNYAHDAGDVLASARYLDHGPENAQGEVPEWPEEGLSNPYKPVSDKAETPSEEKPPQNSATTAPQEPDQWNNRREIPLDTPLARANDGTEFRIVRKGLGGKTPRYSYSVEINSPSLGKKGWTTPNDFFKGFDTPEKAASFILDPKRAQSRLLDLLDPDNESVSKEIPSAIHPSMLLRSPLGGKVLSSSEWDWRPEIVEKSLQDAARMVEERWPGSVTVPLDWAQKHLGFMDDHEWSDFTGRMTANGVVGTMKDTKPYQMVLKGRSSVSAQDPGQSNTTPGEPGETTSQRESGSALETSRRRGPRITEVPGRYIRPPSLPKKVTRWNTDAASGVMEATVPFEDAKLEFRIRPIAGTYDIHVSMPENFEGMTSDYFRARTKAEAKTKVNEWLERYRPSAFIIQPDAESVYYPPEISYDSRAARRRARELSLHLLDKGVALPDTNVSVFRSNEWRSGDGGWVDTKGNFVGYDLQFSPDAEPEYTYNTMLDYPLERQKIVRGEPNPNYRDDAESQPTLEDRIKAAKERNKTQTPQNSVSQEAVDNATLDERGTGDQTSQTSPEEAASMTWERSERIRGKRPVVIHVSGPDNAGRKFVVSSVVRPKNLSTDFETPAAGYEVRIEHPENSSKPPQALGPFRTVAEAKAAAEKWVQENPPTPVPSDEQVTNAALESIATNETPTETPEPTPQDSGQPKTPRDLWEDVMAENPRHRWAPEALGLARLLAGGDDSKIFEPEYAKELLDRVKRDTYYYERRNRSAPSLADLLQRLGLHPVGDEGASFEVKQFLKSNTKYRDSIGTEIKGALGVDLPRKAEDVSDLVEQFLAEKARSSYDRHYGPQSFGYNPELAPPFKPPAPSLRATQKTSKASAAPTEAQVNNAALESVATNETPTETTGNDAATDTALAEMAGEEVPAETSTTTGEKSGTRRYAVETSNYGTDYYDTLEDAKEAARTVNREILEMTGDRDAAKTYVYQTGDDGRSYDTNQDPVHIVDRDWKQAIIDEDAQILDKWMQENDLPTIRKAAFERLVDAFSGSDFLYDPYALQRFIDKLPADRLRPYLQSGDSFSAQDTSIWEAPISEGFPKGVVYSWGNANDERASIEAILEAKAPPDPYYTPTAAQRGQAKRTYNELKRKMEQARIALAADRSNGKSAPAPEYPTNRAFAEASPDYLKNFYANKYASSETSETPTEPRVSYDTLIKIAADSVEKLRQSDVFRVLDSAPEDLREGLAEYIRENRPDLAQEIEDWIIESRPEEPRPVPKAPSYDLMEHPSGIPTDGRVIGTIDGDYSLAITTNHDGSAYQLLRAPMLLSDPKPSDWEVVQESWNDPRELLEKFAHANGGIMDSDIAQTTDPAVKAWLEENKDRIDTDIKQGRGPELYSDVENTSGMRALRETLRGLSDEQIDALRKATRGIARETTVEGTRQFRNKLLTDNNIVDAMNEALEPFGLSLDDVNPNDDYYTDHQKVDVMARQIQREFLARRGYTNPDQRTLDLDTPLPESERYFSPEARAERAGQDPVERALDALATGDQVPTETGNDTATDTAIREMADGVNNLGAGDTTQTPGETTAPTSDSEIESVKEPWQQTKQEYVQERYPYAREVELRDAVRKLEAKEKRLWSDFNKRENHPQRSWVPPPIHHEIQGKTEKAIAATEADLARARAELSSYLTGKGSAEQEYYQRVKQAISEGKPVPVEVLTASMGGADVAELAAIWDISEEEMAKLLEGPAGSSSGNVPQVSTPGETTTSPPESIPLDKPLFSLETPNGARYDFKIQQLPDGQHAMEVRQRNRVEDPKTGEEVWKTVADWHQEKVYPAQATPEDVLAQFFEYRKEFLTRRPDFYTPIDNIHPVVAPHVERLDYKLPEATPQQTPQVPAESPATFSTNHSGMGKKEILEKYYDLLRVADSLARLKEDVPQSPERLARRLEIIEKQLAKHTTKTSEDPRLVEFGKQISEIKSRLVNGAISGEAAHAEMGQMSDAMDAHLRDAYLIETMTPSPEEVFDPHFHHAYDVMTHETLPPDSVGEVLMRGYRLGSNYQTPDGRPSTYEPARILRAPIVTPVVSSEEYAKIKEGAPNATPSTEVTPDPDIQGYLTQGTSLASSATTPAPEGPSQVSEEISPDTPSGTAEGDNTMARSLRPVPGENAGMSDLFEEPEPQAGEPEGLSPEETLRGENIAKALGRPDLTPEQAIMLLSDIYAQGYRKLSAAGETDSSVSEALESFEAEIARIEQGLPSNRQMSPLNKALIYDTAQGILDEYYPAPPEPPAKTPTSPDPTDAQVTDAALESIADPNAPASHPVATPDLGSDAPDSIYFDTPPAASVPDGAKYYYDSGLGTFFRINEAGEVSVAKGSPDAALADLTWTAPSSDPSVLTSIQNRIRTQSLKPLATPEPLEPSVDPAAEALGEMAAKEPPLDGASSPRFSRARLQNMLPFGQSIVNERQMQGQSSPLGPSPAAPPPSAASSPLDGASSPRFSRARLQNMLPFGQSIVNDLLARNASRPPGAPSAPPSGSPPPTAAAPGAPPPNGPNQVRVKYNDPLEDAIKPGGGDRPPGSPETTATGEKLPPKFGPWWIPGMMVGTSIVPEMEKGYSTGANPYGRMLGHGALTAGLLKFGHWADKTSAPLFAQMLEENRLGGRPRVNFGGVMGNQTVPSALTWKQRLGVFGNQFFQKGLNAMGTLSAAEEALSSPGITEQDARQGLVGGLIPVNARAVNALEKVGGLANLGLTATELAGLAGAGMEAAGFAAPGLMGVSAAAAPVALASGIGYAASKGIVEPLTRRYYGGQFGDVQANMGSVPNDPEQARAWTKMRLQRANEILRQNATKDARGHIQFDPTSQQRYKQFINETGSALRSKQGLGISAGAAQTFFDNAYKSSVEDQFNAYNTAKGIDRDFDAAKNEASSLFNISGSPKAWRRPTVGVGTWGSRNDSTNSLMSDSSLSRIGNEPVSPGEDNGLFHRYLGWTGLF